MKIDKLKEELLYKISKAKEEEAFEELNKLIEKDNNIELYFLKAELYEKLEKYGEAINIYKQILEKNPDNEKAINKKEYIETILKFINSDIYASPNTWMDPWD